jgi:hypothetical protein
MNKTIKVSLTLEELNQVLTMLDYAQDQGYFHIEDDAAEQRILDYQNKRFYQITGKFLDAKNEANK